MTIGGEVMLDSVIEKSPDEVMLIKANWKVRSTPLARNLLNQPVDQAGQVYESLGCDGVHDDRDAVRSLRR